MVPILDGLVFFFGIATALGRVMSGRVDALAMQERSNQRVEYYRGGDHRPWIFSNSPSDCVLTTFPPVYTRYSIFSSGGKDWRKSVQVVEGEGRGARRAGFVREGGETGYQDVREQWYQDARYR